MSMIRCSCHGLHGMRAGRAERDAARLGERAELLAPLAEERGGVGERVAAAGADLDLGGDQLADEVRLELRPLRRLLQLLEAVDEVERLGVEERELLLDGDREIGHGLERLARLREHLLVPEPLLLAHARKPIARQITRARRRPSGARSPGLERRLGEQAGGDDLPAPAALDRAARREAELASALGGQREDRGEALAQRGGVARREGEERAQPRARPPRRCRPRPRRGPSARRRPAARRRPPPRRRPSRTPRGRSTARRRRRRAAADAGGGGARARR